MKSPSKNKQSQCESDDTACKHDGYHPDLEPEQRDTGSHTYKQRGPFESALQTMWPQHVKGEKYGEVHDDADHGGSDGCQRRSKFEIAVSRFDEGTAEQNEQKDGRNVKNVTTMDAATAEANIASGPNTALVQPPTKPTKETTMMSGPGVVSPSARPSIICSPVNQW